MSPHDAQPIVSLAGPRCAVCDGARMAPGPEMNGHRFLRCQACGHVFCHPMPTAAVLVAVYNSDQPVPEDPGPDSKGRSRMRRARRRARTLAPLFRGRRFIDVGCGPGQMVEAARRAGAAAAWGIEIDPLRFAQARAAFPACRFERTSVENLGGTVGRFDLVYCSEVIEHVTDVNAFTAALARLTRPGGHLYLTTPDLGHWRTPTDLTRWAFFHPPFHLSFFDVHMLARLLGRHGFDLTRKYFNHKAGLRVLARRREG